MNLASLWSGGTEQSRCRLAVPQVRDLARGAFGYVVLAVDKTTGEQVALKFIERGPQVRSRGLVGVGVHSVSLDLGLHALDAACTHPPTPLLCLHLCALQHINKYVEREVCEKKCI